MATQLSTLHILKAQDHWLDAVRSRIAHVQDFCSSGGTSVMTADPVEIMENELVAISLAMNIFRTQRNAMLPVSILPHDVLSLVFSFLAGEEPATKSNSTTDLGWIKASHVCRFWRQVALQHSRLWSDNVTSTLGGQWLEAMTKRSRLAPISLSYEQLSSRNYELLSCRMSRVQRLQLIDPQPDLWTLAQSCVFPTDMLDTLQVVTSSTTRSGDFRDFPLPDYLFANAPHLRRLIIDGYMVPRLPLFYVNLTHLKISGNENSIQDRSWLLESLRGMTTLKVLTVVGCLPPPVPKSGAEPRNVLPMPHLAELTLAGTSDQCASIMQCLDMPVFTQLSLKLSDTDGAEKATEFANILSCARDHARASPCLNPLRTLWVGNSEDGDALSLRAWVGTCLAGQRKSFEYLEQTASPHVSIEFGRSMLVEGTTLLGVMKPFITPDLRAFCSEVSTWYAEISPRAWKTVLNVSPQVQNVRIGGTPAISFCEALASPSKKGAEFIFPNLKFLELRNIHFGLSSVISDGSLSDLLPQWLAERQSQIALPRLAISRCHIEEECVDMLKELVDVIWDEDCGEYDSDWCSVFSIESDGDGADASYSDEDPEIVQLGRDVVEGRPVD